MLPRLARRLCAGSLSLSSGVWTFPVGAGGLLDFLSFLGTAIPLCLCCRDWARRFLFIFLGRPRRIFGFQLLFFRMGWFRFLRWGSDDIFLSRLVGYLRPAVLSGEVGPLLSMCPLPAVVSNGPRACSLSGHRLSRSVSFVFFFAWFSLLDVVAVSINGLWFPC